MQLQNWRMRKNAGDGKVFFQLMADNLESDDLANASALGMSQVQTTDAFYVIDWETKELKKKYFNGQDIPL
jgi:hypothetical protein